MNQPSSYYTPTYGTSTTTNTTKLSIGESIKGKIHTIGSSRMMKQSINNNKFTNMGVKQSIGNDSDMDFDLDLD
jgi:hypothetical protein